MVKCIHDLSKDRPIHFVRQQVCGILSFAALLTCEMKGPMTDNFLQRLLRLSVTVLICGQTVAGGTRNGSHVTVERLAGLHVRRSMVAKEGSSALIDCNVTSLNEDTRWYNSKGLLLNEETGGKWLIDSKGVLNITWVSFEDRGRYTCISQGPAGTWNDTITLRVAYGAGGLGLYYVIVCLVTFTVTMVLNAARLCMVSSHLKKTERAINEFFRTEGAEKLQQAFEVAKRIPIITSAKTLELAKVTQFKTLEFARHMEDLARNIPLPPLIMNCRTLPEEAGVGLPQGEGMPAEGNPASASGGQRQAICLPGSAERQECKVHMSEASCSIPVSVHHCSERAGAQVSVPLLEPDLAVTGVA